MGVVANGVVWMNTECFGIVPIAFEEESKYALPHVFDVKFDRPNVYVLR